MKNSVPTTDAIAIARFRLTDSSLIVVWLTEQCGKIRTTARGALRPQSPFAGKIDLFHETHISIQLSSKSDLHTLKEVEMRIPFPAGSLPYAATLGAGYFSRWIDWVTQPLEPVPKLYSLLHRAFAYLREGRLNENGIMHFERELAKLLGIHDASGVEPVITSLSHYANRKPIGREELLHEVRKNQSLRAQANFPTDKMINPDASGV